MSRALVAVRKGRRDVSGVALSAKADLQVDIVVEPFEVDSTTRFDARDPKWSGVEFITFSEDLRDDPALQPLILSIQDAFVRLDLPEARPWFRSPPEEGDIATWPWLFTCNICGTQNRVYGTLPGREEPSCIDCRSTVRYRATVRALVEALLGRNTALPGISQRSDMRGLGISDWQGYADKLASLFTYTNTYLDSEPRLDLTNPPPKELRGAFDFAVAGDVFEHVAPPVESAMNHLRTVLRPTGLAILTVPFTRWPNHVEHFPNLYHWDIEESGEEPVLINERADGSVERFTSLCFHGPGRSLEMRVFTESSFLEALRSSGFVNVRLSNHPGARNGILLTDWAGPVVAYSA